jgi:hypothetical protein
MLQQQQQAQEEASKLAKQMRIQNKAKFVTKKLKMGVTADDALTQTQTHAPSASSSSMNLVNLMQQQQQGQLTLLQTSSTSAGPISSSALQHKSSFSMDAVPTQPQAAALPIINLGLPIQASSNAAADAHADEPEQSLPAEFMEKLLQAQTELEVKAIQRALMTEKRTIRLQQQQNVNADAVEGTATQYVV